MNSAGHNRDHCPCDECHKARKYRRFIYDRGFRLMKDQEPVKNRILELREQGFSNHEIALVSGLSTRALYMISSGRTTKCNQETYDKIMNIKPEQFGLLRNEKNVDSKASKLRVQALVALGYKQSWIAEQLGRHHFGLDIRDRITRRRALDILDLAKKIGDTPGPSHKAAATAINKGWKKPIEYDEDMFYDPHWDGNVPEETCEEVKWADKVLEDYDFLVSTGLTDTHLLSERLGVKRDTLVTLIRKRQKRLSEEIEQAS